MSIVQRIPEPELMTGPEQAKAYAEADFSESNLLFVGLFQEQFPDFASGSFVDFGCGPADIPIRLARQYPHCSVIALDGSRAMLDLAQHAVNQSGYRGRIQLQQALLGNPENLAIEKASAHAVISNSLLHHMSDPKDLWHCIRTAGKPGAKVLVMDLLRPRTTSELAHLVEIYAADAPEVLKSDFKNSLFAAYTVAEVQGQLQATGLSDFEIRMVSDRHWMVSGFCPGD